MLCVIITHSLNGFDNNKNKISKYAQSGDRQLYKKPILNSNENKNIPLQREWQKQLSFDNHLLPKRVTA